MTKPSEKKLSEPKREASLTIKFRAPDWMTQEFVETNWRDMLKGYTGEPAVWREGPDFVMRGDFGDAEEAARFAARVTNLTGVRAEIGPFEQEN
jgi:hypothetical protein